jgi:hypothetical protein
VSVSLSVVWDGRKLQFLSRAQLGGDLGLVSQISMHDLVSRFDCFLYCKQTKERKNAKIAVLQNLRFLCRAESD